MVLAYFFFTETNLLVVDKNSLTLLFVCHDSSWENYDWRR